GRPPLRPRAGAPALTPAAGASWPLGTGPVSVALRAGTGGTLGAPADARVVPGDRRTGPVVRAGRAVGAAARRRAAARARDAHGADPAGEEHPKRVARM